MVIGIDNLSVCPNVQSRIQVVCIVLPTPTRARSACGAQGEGRLPRSSSGSRRVWLSLHPYIKRCHKQVRSTPLFPLSPIADRGHVAKTSALDGRSTPLDPCSTPNIRPATCHVGLRHRPYTHICDPNLAAFHPNATPYSHVPNDHFANRSNGPTFRYAIQTADTAIPATFRCKLSCSTGGTNSLVFRVGPPKNVRKFKKTSVV
jgi:hypothetical protein